jgi:hypothetical protein
MQRSYELLQSAQAARHSDRVAQGIALRIAATKRDPR